MSQRFARAGPQLVTRRLQYSVLGQCGMKTTVRVPTEILASCAMSGADGEDGKGKTWCWKKCTRAETEEGFLLQNGGGTWYSVGGGIFSIPGSGDARLQVMLKQGHLWVQANGTNVLYDAKVCRFSSPFAPSIVLGTQSNPYFTVNRIAVGQSTLCRPTFTDAELFGPVNDGTYEGNALNHESSIGLTNILQGVIDSTNLSVS